jgi:hypothetical protein
MATGTEIGESCHWDECVRTADLVIAVCDGSRAQPPAASTISVEQGVPELIATRLSGC